MAHYRAARSKLELADGERGGPTAEYVAGQTGLTPSQLEAFVSLCLAKYATKRIDPGADVGGGPGGGRSK